MQIKVPDINLLIHRYQGNYSIIEKVISLGHDTEERFPINKVWIALKVFIISDSLVVDKNIVKSCYREGLRDNSSVSISYWLNSVLSKKDIII